MMDIFQDKAVKIIVSVFLLFVFLVFFGLGIIGTGEVLGWIIGGLLAWAVVRFFVKFVLPPASEDSYTSSDVNTTVGGLRILLLLIGAFLLFFGLMALPWIIINKLGPVHIAQQTGGTGYTFSYLASEAMPGYVEIPCMFLYIIAIIVLVFYLMMGFTLFLGDIISSGHPPEFAVYRQHQRSLRITALIAIIFLSAFTCVYIDTYTLIEEKGIVYNGPFSFNQIYYGWDDVTGIIMHQVSEEEVHYFLLVSDGTHLKINEAGSTYVGEKTGLTPVNETKSSFYE